MHDANAAISDSADIATETDFYDSPNDTARATNALDNLDRFFEQEAASQVINARAEADDNSNNQTNEETGEEPTAPEKSDDEVTSEQNDDGSQNDELPFDPETDAADFDSLTKIETASVEEAAPENTEGVAETDLSAEFPDAEALKAKYTRNANKELLAEAAELSAKARASAETIQSLGGTEQIEHLSLINSGVRESDTAKILQGIAGASGEQASLKVMADSVHFAFNTAATLKENPETAPFGEALESYTDTILQNRFGENVTIKAIEEFADLQQQGSIELFQKWTAQGYVDHEEWFSYIDGLGTENQSTASTFQTQAQKIKLLEDQLAAAKQPVETDKSDKSADTNKTPAVEIDSSFYQTAQTQLATSLNSVLKTSVLRDVGSDTPEMKQQKSYLRDQLVSQVAANFKADPKAKELYALETKGETETQVYKDLKVEVYNRALQAAREKTSISEAIAAAMYGKKRNASVKKNLNAAVSKDASLNDQPRQPQQQLAPTQTQNFAESRAPKSVQDVDKKLSAAMNALG